MLHLLMIYEIEVYLIYCEYMYLFPGGIVVMYKTIDNLKINYELVSNGAGVNDTCLFILHGWGANLELYRSISDVVSEKYPVIMFDFPGFGKSTEPQECWDVARFARLAIEFINSFDYEKIILLGHSFGGRVIIKISAEYVKELTSTINKIILVDSAGVLHKKSVKVRLKEKAYKTVKRVLSFYPIQKIWPNAIGKLQSKMGSADYAKASPIMRQCLVKTVNEDLTPLLTSIQQSTLLIWGDQDTATPLSDGKIMEKMIPDAGLVVMEGAGHFSYLDKPHVFNAVLKSFLEIGA